MSKKSIQCAALVSLFAAACASSDSDNTDSDLTGSRSDRLIAKAELVFKVKVDESHLSPELLAFRACYREKRNTSACADLAPANVPKTITNLEHLARGDISVCYAVRRNLMNFAKADALILEANQKAFGQQGTAESFRQLTVIDFDMDALKRDGNEVTCRFSGYVSAMFDSRGAAADRPGQDRAWWETSVHEAVVSTPSTVFIENPAPVNGGYAYLQYSGVNDQQVKLSIAPIAVPQYEKLAQVYVDSVPWDKVTPGTDSFDAQGASEAFAGYTHEDVHLKNLGNPEIEGRLYKKDLGAGKALEVIVGMPPARRRGAPPIAPNPNNRVIDMRAFDPDLAIGQTAVANGTFARAKMTRTYRVELFTIPDETTLDDLSFEAMQPGDDYRNITYWDDHVLPGYSAGTDHLMMVHPSEYRKQYLALSNEMQAATTVEQQRAIVAKGQKVAHAEGRDEMTAQLNVAEALALGAVGRGPKLSYNEMVKKSPRLLFGKTQR
jgi:hypothetical protein